MSGPQTTNQRMLGYELMKAYPDISCFSTTRHGGCSRGAYASFNCNDYCGDDPADVARNRQLLASLIPVPGVELVIPHQTHGVEVRVIDDTYIYRCTAGRASLLEGVDALVTDRPAYCLCISTADCIPLLLYDVRHRAVGAVHAGWRGTVGRIVEKTLAVMNDRYGTEGGDVVACIGPGISQAAFEVGDEVYEAFREAGFPMSALARREEKWHIDLWEANRIQLLACGVRPSHIEVAGICTYGRNGDFFSARRQGIRSGRILSGIVMRPKD